MLRDRCSLFATLFLIVALFTLILGTSASMDCGKYVELPRISPSRPQTEEEKEEAARAAQERIKTVEERRKAAEERRKLAEKGRRTLRYWTDAVKVWKAADEPVNDMDDSDSETLRAAQISYLMQEIVDDLGFLSIDGVDPDAVRCISDYVTTVHEITDRTYRLRLIEGEGSLSQVWTELTDYEGWKKRRKELALLFKQMDDYAVEGKKTRASLSKRYETTFPLFRFERVMGLAAWEHWLPPEALRGP